MAGPKLLLIDTLRALSLGGAPPLADADAGEQVRAALLVVSSASPDACAAAERIGYEVFDDETTGTAVELASVSLPEAGMTLRDVIEELQGAAMPAALAEARPELGEADYRAALYAIRCILYALERSGFDAQHPEQYTREESERLLARTIAQLAHFRATGEP